MPHCRGSVFQPSSRNKSGRSDPLVIIEREGKVGFATLNRPDKRNALSTEFRYALDAALGELEADREISVVVILAAGAVFCAGFDKSELFGLPAEKQAAFRESAYLHHKRLAEFKKPLIAGIHGSAMGGGFDLAVLCDIRIAAPEARFAHPEIKFGAAVMFRPLLETIGGGPAREIVLTGRTVEAEEALRLGLVSRIVPAADLRAECLKTALQIAEAPAGTLQMAKSMIVRTYGGWTEDGASGGIFARPN